MKFYTVKGPIHDYFNTLFSIKKRLDKVKNGEDRPVNSSTKTNDLAKRLHPDSQHLIISDIKQLNANTKCYTLRREDNLPTAYFRAGQYLCFTINIGSAIVKRPYSISSSPDDALRGEYKITVQKRIDAFASAFIFDNWIVGTRIEASAPEGKLYNEPLRDAERLLCFASPDGIGAVLSIAKAVASGTEKVKLKIVYCCNKAGDIIYKDELDRLASVSASRVEVIYFLTGEKRKGYSCGKLNSAYIKKLIDKFGECSIFVSSHNELYYLLKNELENLSIPKKFIRFETFGKPIIDADSSLVDKINNQVFNCHFIFRDEPEMLFTCRGNETLLSAIERSGISIPSHCHGGECGFCRLKLLSGDVVISDDNDGRRIADRKFGYIHPCASFPISDVILKL